MANEGKDLNVEMPEELRRRFHAACVLRGVFMKDVVRAFAEKFIVEISSGQVSGFVKEVIQLAIPPEKKVLRLPRKREVGRRGRRPLL